MNAVVARYGLDAEGRHEVFADGTLSGRGRTTDTSDCSNANFTPSSP
jgi:hypothetical protein